MSAIRRLGEVSRAYELAADEYRAIALRAAEAEAAHKSARARMILQVKARETERISHAEAEARAEADEEIANRYRERLIAAALQDSHGRSCASCANRWPRAGPPSPAAGSSTNFMPTD